MAKEKDDFFGSDSEVRAKWITWGKVGDHVRGTLINVREINSTLPGKEHEKVKVYELKAKDGSYHAVDDKKNPIEPPVEVKEGEIVSISGRLTIDNALRNMKLGTIIGLLYKEEKEAKKRGYSGLKIISVHTKGEIDKEWKKEQEDMGDEIEMS